MAWHPAYIVLILGSTVVDYIAGLRIHGAKSQATKKAWLTTSLVVNLGLLFTFKYFNFFSRATAEVLKSFFGLEISAPVLDVLLPVGISFYTFQTLSYTIDIYRGTLEPTRNFFRFAFFVTYFPQLVAGPIVRASELLPQLKDKATLRRSQVTEGLFLIGTGLVKKVAIADFLSVNLVDRVFDNPDLYTSAEVVVGLYAFTMQIYCDFSGYTDCARGSAKLMGLELPRNFDRPYQASSPAEFLATLAYDAFHVASGLSVLPARWLTRRSCTRVLEPLVDDVSDRHLAWRIVDVRCVRVASSFCDGDSPLLLQTIGTNERHRGLVCNACVQGVLGTSVCSVLPHSLSRDKYRERARHRAATLLRNVHHGADLHLRMVRVVDIVYRPLPA